MKSMIFSRSLAVGRNYFLALGSLLLLSLSACSVDTGENSGVSKKPEKPTEMSQEKYEKYLKIIEDSRKNIAEKEDFSRQDYLNLAFHSDILGDFETAKENYKKILEKNSNDFVANNNLANIYEKEGKAEEALEIFIRLSENNPGMLEPFRDAANLFKKLGKKKEGKKFVNDFSGRYTGKKDSYFTNMIRDRLQAFDSE